MFDIHVTYSQLPLDLKTCIDFISGFLMFRGVLGVEVVFDSRVWPVPWGLRVRARLIEAAWSIFVGNFRFAFCLSPGIRIFVVHVLARRYRDDINRLSYSGAAGHRAESVPFASGPRSRCRAVSRAIRSPSSVRSGFGTLEVSSAIVFLLGGSQVSGK